MFNLNYNLKYVCFFTFTSYIIFINDIYIHIYDQNFIDIDNEINEIFYENDTKFDRYETNFKPIAFYYPEYNNVSYFKYFKKKKKKILDNNDIEKLVNAQVKLAREHKIYGFAIYYNLFEINKYNKITTNLFLNKISFPFFLIWKNDELDTIDIRTIKILMNNIVIYIKSDNYIKIQEKPILSINEPKKLINKTKIILFLRKIAKEKIGNIFLLYPYKGNFTSQNFFREFDALYDFSKLNLFKDITYRPNILYYSGFIYKNLILNNLDINYRLFRTCYINLYNFDDYKPEKLYFQNIIIIKSEKDKYIYNEGFIFIDSWNDYFNGNYLEFDEKYGYSAINTISKSILNIPYQTNNFTIIDNDRALIAIHIHVFYEDLLDKIISRINLIPIKYDLFISTISKEKLSFIKNKLINSNHNNYEIRIFENRGRDVYSFIYQMKRHYKHYKYICHLHTKKSLHKFLLGLNWSEYIYKNLIGSKLVISNILYDFENNEKLGIIFPEAYYEIIKEVKYFDNTNFALNKPNKKYMNIILKSIFHKYKVGEKLIFPVGNMFWARIKAIYQIFNLRLEFPDELGQTNETIMHAIERIWLYIVKLNGYSYKTIFKKY